MCPPAGSLKCWLHSEFVKIQHANCKIVEGQCAYQYKKVVSLHVNQFLVSFWPAELVITDVGVCSVVATTSRGSAFHKEVTHSDG